MVRSKNQVLKQNNKQTMKIIKDNRITIEGYDSSVVEEREPLSEWASSVVEEDGKSRAEHAWRRFKHNRSAMIGSAIIIMMVVVTILSRPIEVPEMVPLLSGITVQPFSLAPYPPAVSDYGATHMPPSLAHPFGTDWTGRDILSRVMYGARFSLSIGFIAVAMMMAIGIPLGSIAGYFGGWIDEIVMRVVDILYAFPFLVLAIAVVAIVGRGFWNLVFALVIVGWISYARLIRGEILSVKEKEYVTAAKALGGTSQLIIVRHVIPNAVGPVLIYGTLAIGNTVLTAAALGFLGLGLEPVSAEWGAMLSFGRDTLIQGHWWVTVFPGLAIFAFVMAINLVGDGLRDAFDPQSESEGAQLK